MVAGNLSVSPFFPFEDWWVHPDLVDSSIIEKFTIDSNKTNAVEEYMLKDFKYSRSFQCTHE